MQRDYEVIVVGAGPAGATLAYELAEKGIGVLVIEQATLPRYKCCAGGLTVKAAEQLGNHAHGLVEGAISSAVVTFPGDSPYRGEHEDTIIYTVMREKFDHALVKRAEEAGANILQGLKVCGIRFNGTGVEISTATGNFRSQYVAGADGAKSIVAKALGINTNRNCLVGIETEVAVDSDELLKWKSQIAIELGRIPAGYAWVFPKTDHLSIGIGCLANEAKNLKRCYREFVDSLSLGHYTVGRWYGSVIPICTGQAVVTRDRAVLLGDAAGLADPLTGEGIYNAILSAQLAAPAIGEALIGGEVKLLDYRKSVEEKIMPEMRIAYVFSRVLAQFPHRLFKLLKRDERIWRECCHLLRGETDYSTIKDKMGPLSRLYDLFVLRR